MYNSELKLTDEQIESIAEKAAEKAIAKLTEQVYMEVGKGVVSKFIWILGACAVGFVGWAKGKGLL